MNGVRLAINVIGFQAVWLGAVGGAAAGRLWVGPVAAAVLVAVHLALSARPSRELAAVALVAAAGTLWDVLPAVWGLIEYAGGVPALAGVPYWIAALWLAFATTLNVSLRWLRSRPVLAIGMGAIAGPLCYQAAEALGALNLTPRGVALATQAAAWAALLPAVSAVAARYDGVERAHV